MKGFVFVGVWVALYLTVEWYVSLFDHESIYTYICESVIYLCMIDCIARLRYIFVWRLKPRFLKLLIYCPVLMCSKSAGKRERSKLNNCWLTFVEEIPQDVLSKCHSVRNQFIFISISPPSKLCIFMVGPV